jgi:lipoprotein-anchoring transpeptidase ErfK/SrfK
VKVANWVLLLTLLPLIQHVPAGAETRRPGKQVKKGSADRVKTERAPEPRFDAALINDPNLRDHVGDESEGSATLRAQILLDRVHFSPGEIDGRYGRNLNLAIQGFQANRNLPPTGVIDGQTWELLNADSEPVLVYYTIAEEDVAGPFRPFPEDMMEKGRLDWLGYQSPAEALGEKFHISPRLLAELNPDKELGRAGEQILVPNVVREYGLVRAERVIVSETRGIVLPFAAGGTLLAQYPATIGGPNDPLPLGEWKVTLVKRNPIFNYNPDLFWDADPSHSKARIPPGPNNPVGVVWIGLSKEHYGIHGSPWPNLIGHTQSHGCIRLTNWDAAELSHMIDIGTTVILQEP